MHYSTAYKGASGYDEPPSKGLRTLERWLSNTKYTGEFYLGEKARINIESGLRITKVQILEFVAELLKGDINDKAY